MAAARQTRTSTVARSVVQENQQAHLGCRMWQFGELQDRALAIKDAEAGICCYPAGTRMCVSRTRERVQEEKVCAHTKKMEEAAENRRKGTDISARHCGSRLVQSGLQDN